LPVLGFFLGLFSNERCYRYIQFGGMNMALYLCRWGNGDFSIVQASNKEHAIEMLDEVANAEGVPLYAIKEFMVHFRLTDEGTIELEEFGDGFSEYVLNRVHPILGNLHISPYDASAKNKAKIRAAVQAEKQVSARTIHGDWEENQGPDRYADVCNQQACSKQS
jgi:hypothetical protein